MIGLELGSVWRRLGAEVTVVEFLDRILPGIDGEVAKQFQRLLEKQGFKFRLGHKVSKVEKAGSGVKATIEPAAGGEPQVLQADVVLVAIGRRPYTEDLGLEAARRRDGARAGRRRRPFRDQRPGRLRHRRRGARADARPQGRG